MKNNKKKYITTAIDYPNGKPHIGHAYEKILADTYSRWYSLLGYKTYFRTGTDENGQKLVLSSENKGVDTRKFVDENVLEFKKLCSNFSINYDSFIRTTDDIHSSTVNKIFSILKDKEFIYKGSYSGQYCYGCESYKKESQLEDGNCPDHKEDLVNKKEEGYFFALSKLQEKILDFYNKNPKFIVPEDKSKEIIKFLKTEKLTDLSITRENKYNWGIPLEQDSKFVYYTWFDALINYYSGAEEVFSPELQIIGKDIVWFHGVIWLGILIACELPLPKEIYVHGIITDAEGFKLSKSKGNFVDIDKLLNSYDSDVLRYYLLYKISSKSGGRFSEKELAEIFKADFVQGIGNLYSRICSLYLKKDVTADTPVDDKFSLDEDSILKTLSQYLEAREHDRSIDYLKEQLGKINRYLNDNQPWSKECQNPEEVLQTSLLNFKKLIKFYQPFIPNIVEKIEVSLKDGVDFKGHLFKF